MSLRQLAISADNVTEGMYVSKLDRPWLETPFLFQGFEIRERSEIDLLKQYCEVVYVDIDRGDINDAVKQSLLQSQQVSQDVPGARPSTPGVNQGSHPAAQGSPVRQGYCPFALQRLQSGGSCGS